MDNNPQTGIFGKLPLHGDFIYRNLPSDCMTSWDEWLQRYIAGSREQLSNEWLDTYLTSPIWRFAMSEGVLDESAWMGMMVPSVDRVGRYFPISILSRIPAQVNLFEYMMLQTDWFEKVEERVLDALDAQLDVDELMTVVDEIELNQHTAYDNVQRLENHSSTVISMEFEEQSPSSVYPHFLDSFLSLTLASYSVWTTTGSERVEPCMSITQGLPKIGGIASMLDGQWSYWNWQQPYKLRLSESMAPDIHKVDLSAAEPDNTGYNAPVIKASDIGAASLDDSYLDSSNSGIPDPSPSDFNGSDLISPDLDILDKDVSDPIGSDFQILDNDLPDPFGSSLDILDKEISDPNNSDFHILDNELPEPISSDFNKAGHDILDNDLSDLNITDNDVSDPKRSK